MIDNSENKVKEMYGMVVWEGGLFEGVFLV